MPFLSTEFGLREFAVKGAKERLAHYRRFAYEKGGLLQEPTDLKKGLELSDVDRFRYRTRYFTDSGIIGTKEFVSRVYQDFKGYFASRHQGTKSAPSPLRDWTASIPFRKVTGQDVFSQGGFLNLSGSSDKNHLLLKVLKHIFCNISHTAILYCTTK